MGGDEVKSLSHIFENIVEYHNIIDTMFKAMTGKHKSDSVKNFLHYNNILDNATAIQNGLINGTLPVQEEREPKIIHEPSAKKDRKIYPPHNDEHVIHHLVCQELEPMFMRGMYEFCVASVPNRGSSYGRKFMEKWLKHYEHKKLYVLKLDIHHFFDSIDRRILFEKLSARIKDDRFREVVRKILWYDGNDNNVGIPIGFYTSQWFANFFLQDFDHFIKQELKIPYYMRYMDDMVLLSPNKRKLRFAQNTIRLYLEKIGFELNDNQQLFRFSYLDLQGKEKGRAIDFMGYVFHCNRTTIRKHTLYRARKKANKISKKKKHNWYEASQIISMTGRLKGTDTHKFFDKYIQPKVDLQKMRTLVGDHSKKQARERWNHNEPLQSNK